MAYIYIITWLLSENTFQNNLLWNISCPQEQTLSRKLYKIIEWRKQLNYFITFQKMQEVSSVIKPNWVMPLYKLNCTKAQPTQKKNHWKSLIHNWTWAKLKTSVLQILSRNVKRQLTEWEKLFGNHISDKGLVIHNSYNSIIKTIQ